MPDHLRSRAALTCLVALAALQAQAGCDAAFLEHYRECVRLVDSLRPDKAGQARVYASDGSEFTAGQALWMKGQIRTIGQLCASPDPAAQEEAARRLTAVADLLRSHRRA